MSKTKNLTGVLEKLNKPKFQIRFHNRYENAKSQDPLEENKTKERKPGGETCSIIY